jgi:transposase
MLERAIDVKRVLLIAGATDRAGGVSAYTIAKLFSVSPQTVHNWLLKHGKRVGIASVKIPHRKDIDKKLYYAVTEQAQQFSEENDDYPF